MTDGVDAIIVMENNKDGWANAILKIYDNREFAENISNHALDTNKKYTWRKRSVAITEFIGKTIK